MRPLPTVLMLSLAAAFGGFVATVLRDGVPSPATATTTVTLEETPAMQSGPADISAPPQTLLTSVAGSPEAVDSQPLPSLAPMLQRVMPSVVSVQTTQRQQVSPFGNDPFFRRMFPELSQERIAQSLGSGVIVDAENGYVLTNHHVIEGADEVTVTLSDGRSLRAEFVGSDADTDVALMRIPAEQLTAIPLADDNRLEVGDFVVAVGNPFGVGQTVTSGIVSAVGRSNVPGVGYQNFIQTDASINPGNSGGALVDLRGRLVGINTASFNPRGSAAGNIGLGFAIPASLAGNVMHQLLAVGEVRRGTLGIETQSVDAKLATGLGLTAPRGAVVTRIHRDSSAGAAGLHMGDVIVAANGQRIDSSDALRNFQGLQPVDSMVRLDVIRDGTSLHIDARLDGLPREGSHYDLRLSGVTFSELPEAVRRQNNRAFGVLVESVERGSRAARNGVREGDLVFQVNWRDCNDLAGLRDLLADHPPQLVLGISRRGRTGTLLME